MSLLDTASLIVTPNGYKEGKLYSVIPSDGSGDLSVTRATTATRVNSAGLVELVPYNLLQYSQDFSNAYWFGEPGNTITSNTTTAPDGTLTADTFTATAGNEINVHNLNGFSLADGTFTYSIYLKNNGTNLIEAYLFKVGVGFAARGEINFSAGTFTASIGTGSIENVGNGWFRVSLTNTYTSGTFTTGTYTTSTTGTRSVFAWGAQLVEGSVAKDYQKTETRLNIPRLDYSNGTCPSILVEPQRTNLLTYSSSFDNAAWTKQEITITTNATIAPDGTQTADKAIPTTVTSTHQIATGTLISSTQCAFGVFAKADGYNTIEILDRASAANGARFNILNGTIEQTFGTATATITDFGNGWYRCVVVANTTGVRFYIPTSASNFTGNGTSGIFIWGAQLEVGSYATSYIPTTSASVTRNADVISKTGISSLIGQTEGTLFWEGQGNTQSTGFDLWLFAASVNDTTTAFLLYYVHSSGYINCYINNGSSFVNLGTPMDITINNKIAVGYKSGDFVMYINGVQVDSNTSATAIPSGMNQVAINKWAGFTGEQKQSTKAAALWKTRLTNTQLAQLTTI